MKKSLIYLSWWLHCNNLMSFNTHKRIFDKLNLKTKKDNKKYTF